jgi:hypothetical protein
MFNAKQSGDCSWDPKSKDPLLRAVDNFSYPTVFYRFMHTFIGGNTQVSGMIMRLVNSLIASILLFFAIILSPVKSRNSLLISFVSTLVPLGIFLIPSLNPSAWAYLSLTFGWIFLANATSDKAGLKSTRNSNWILFLCCLVMAFGSRWDAGVYFLVSTVAVIVLNNLFRNFFKKLNHRKKLILGASFASGLIVLSYYYIPRIIDIANHGIFPMYKSRSDWSPKSLFLYNVVHLIELPSGIFGYGQWGLGWFDTPLPAVVAFIGTTIYAFFILQSLPFKRVRNYLVVLALMAFVALLLIVSLTLSSIPVGDTLQPRYILPMMSLIAGMAIWSSRSNSPFGTEPLARAIVIGVLISLANAVSLWTNIKRYTVGLRQSQGYTFIGPHAWWWSWGPSPSIVFVIGVISFSLFIFSAFKLILISEKSTADI